MSKIVVVWTASRPWLVACGELVSREGQVVTLRNARCGAYWSADTRTVLGLASRGPTSGARISPPCEEVEIAIEGMATASPEAVAAWEREPWS